MQKLRVAFFIDAMEENLDGVAITSHQIISRIGTYNIEALFFTGNPPKSPDFYYPLVKARSITFPGLNGYRLAIPKRKRIFRLLDDFKPDLIHWSSPTFLGKMAVSYSEARSIPNVSIYHTHFVSYADYLGGLPFKSKAVRWANNFLLNLYGKTAFVLPPTSEMRDYLLSIGLPWEKIIIWGRGVDCDRFTPAKREEGYFAGCGLKGSKNVLFVSRLVSYKETDLLIELSHLLPEDTNLIIVGSGPEEEKMKKRSKASNTAFLGKLEGDELAKAYASSDLFVFPSLSETFGNVVQEALASGLPVVAANAGGPKSIVKHGETGFLVEPRNADAVLDRINQLLADNGLYKKMQGNARTYAESQTWDRLVEDLVAIYLKAITKGKPFD